MDIKLFDRILALGNLIGLAQLGYVETNLAFQITSWNNGASKIFGYPEDDMIGRHLDTLIPINIKEYSCSKQTAVISLSDFKMGGKKFSTTDQTS